MFVFVTGETMPSPKREKSYRASYHPSTKRRVAPKRIAVRGRRVHRTTSVSKGEQATDDSGGGDGGPCHTPAGSAIIFYCVLHEDGLREAIKTFLESTGRTQSSKITGNNGIKSDFIPRDEENVPLEYDGHGIFTGLARLICARASSAEIAKYLRDPDSKFSTKEIGSRFLEEIEGDGIFKELPNLILAGTPISEIAEYLYGAVDKFSDKEIGTLFHPKPESVEISSLRKYSRRLRAKKETHRT